MGCCASRSAKVQPNLVLPADASAWGLKIPIETTFAKFDKNRDNTIDVNELHEALTYIGLQPDSKQATLQVMRQYDKDNNHGLQLEEFRLLVQRSRRHLLQAETVFRFFDRNKSGSLDLDELFAALSALGLAQTIDDAKAVMIKYKYIPSASLELHEFSKVIERARNFQVNVSAFERFDTDHNGSINVGELHCALYELGLATNEKLAQQVMGRFGGQHGGELSMDLQGYLQLVDAIVTFRAHDRDQNGGIDANELHRALFELALSLSFNQTKQVMRLFDKDGNNLIDLHEFCEIVDRIKAFREFDTSHSGSIELEELPAMLPRLGLPIESLKEAEAVMDKYDKDRDGSLQVVEFLHLVIALKQFQGR